MAVTAGIEMSECKLFEGKSGRVYFGTKRFDRIGNKRLHMHTASGIMHDNFRMSAMDYGHLLDCAFRLEKHVQAYEKIFRLAAFNVYAYNRDDHSKNFSFLMNAKGEWRFAPAYDLTFSYSGYGFHSTMVAGESKNPGRKELMKLATLFGIKNAKTIIEQVQEAISNWDRITKESGVSKENKTSPGITHFPAKTLLPSKSACWTVRSLLYNIRQMPDKLSDSLAWREVRVQRGIWQDGVGRRDTVFDGGEMNIMSQNGTWTRCGEYTCLLNVNHRKKISDQSVKQSLPLKVEFQCSREGYLDAEGLVSKLLTQIWIYALALSAAIARTGNRKIPGAYRLLYALV
jgi:hypothetical protein